MPIKDKNFCDQTKHVGRLEHFLWNVLQIYETKLTTHQQYDVTVKHISITSSFQELLSDMDHHEETLKLLTNITDFLIKEDWDENTDDRCNDANLIQDIKHLQTLLYKLWLRLLEWECLLEGQQLGHLQVRFNHTRNWGKIEFQWMPMGWTECAC